MFKGHNKIHTCILYKAKCKKIQIQFKNASIFFIASTYFQYRGNGQL